MIKKILFLGLFSALCILFVEQSCAGTVKGTQKNYLTTAQAAVFAEPANPPIKLPAGEDPKPDVPTTNKAGIYLTPHTYPRLSLGTSWAQDWINKPEGMQFLYRFQEIYGHTMSEEVLMLKQRAILEGHATWAKNTIWIQNDCLSTASDYETEPPEWAYGLARNNVINAITIAVYKNKQLGVDWFLRDIHGQKMRIWSDTNFALNLTPDCPLGAWDGSITYQGHQYNLGDSRGLTLTQWLKGPFTQAVIRGSLFAQAFQGLQTEDSPSGWLYYFNGQIPDPRGDGIGFPDQNEFVDYCRPVWREWFLEFLKPLQDKFIVRVNGHNTRWYFEGYENPMPEIQQAFTGCKLERYFGWGGWPGWDKPTWIKTYLILESLYHPLSQNPNDPAFDARQGTDVSTLQMNVRYAWSDAKKDRWKRSGLASALMADGLFDGYAYEEDYYFGAYLRGGQTQYAPRGVPQMQFKLGKALGPCRLDYSDQLHPLYYRRFFDKDTQTRYTVVLNVWAFPIADIPAEDGVWFFGDWPNGQYAPVF